jgi:hypothetical protein
MKRSSCARGDKDRFLGKGVMKAVQNVNTTIAPEIVEMDATEQTLIDQRMLDLDGTETKSNLGANAISAFRWPWRAPPPIRSACRSTSTWAGSMPRCCPCR